MKVLLDTNIISEARPRRTDRNVMSWLDGLDEDRTFISVISIAELQRGVKGITEGSRRAASLFERFFFTPTGIHFARKR